MNEKHRSGKLPKSKGAPAIIQARIKSQQALELRLAGQTYQQIANAIDRSVSSAQRAVHRALGCVVDSKTAEKYRLLEIVRLERLLNAVWEKAISGAGTAIDRALRIIDLQARIAGVYVAINIGTIMPGGLKNEVPMNLTDEERLQKIMAIFERVKARQEAEALDMKCLGDGD